MSPSYSKWKVSGYLRPVMDQNPTGEWWPTGKSEQIAVISDERGWTWEVVVTGSTITALTVEPHSGVKLTQSVLRGTQFNYLRDTALSFWREVDQWVGDGMQVSDALLETSGEAGALGTIVGKPTLETFSALWNSTPARTNVKGTVLTRRAALRQVFARPDGSRVSKATIDAWTREARDKGLIQAPTTGRGHIKPAQRPPAASDRRALKETER